MEPDGVGAFLLVDGENLVLVDPADVTIVRDPQTGDVRGYLLSAAAADMLARLPLQDHAVHCGADRVREGRW